MANLNGRRVPSGTFWKPLKAFPPKLDWETTTSTASRSWPLEPLKFRNSAFENRSQAVWIKQNKTWRRACAWLSYIENRLALFLGTRRDRWPVAACKQYRIAHGRHHKYAILRSGSTKATRSDASIKGQTQLSPHLSVVIATNASAGDTHIGYSTSNRTISVFIKITKRRRNSSEKGKWFRSSLHSGANSATINTFIHVIVVYYHFQVLPVLFVHSLTNTLFTRRLLTVVRTTAVKDNCSSSRIDGKNNYGYGANRGWR